MRMRTVLLSGFVLLAAISGEARATGFATYFASLAANGATNVSSGVSATARPGLGIYTVTFTRPITNCACTVSVMGATSGFASAQRTASDEMTVRTFTTAGVAQNLPSNMILVCGP
jgi:hypothetical protein